jgi:hypothetical protein
MTGKPKIEVLPSLTASTRSKQRMFSQVAAIVRYVPLRSRHPQFPRAVWRPRPQNYERHKRRLMCPGP